jgi:cyanophycinase-like exopeptidase
MYRDTTAAGSVQYYYVVRAVDLSGNRSDPSNEATVVTTGIGGAADLPASYSLLQNYPNPFNPATVIPYELPASGDVRLTVYDMLGREVAVLVNERRGPGRYEAVFHAAELASGVYLYRLTAGGFVQTRRMALVR